MSFADSFKNHIHSLDADNFEEAALEVFRYQWAGNPLYQQYAKSLKRHTDNVRKLADIPFLPIAFFKSHSIKTGDWEEQTTFLSSGTTSSKVRSSHPVRDMAFYLHNAEAGFENLVGPISDCVFLGLLPSYQKQGNSSLIAMFDHFIEKGKPPSQYLEKNEYNLNITQAESIILMGVSYALLDATSFPNYPNLKIMETGGMKGRRKEMIRNELHQRLKSNFHTTEIASEYGMTELMSQAYALTDGIFQFPPWARVLVRDVNDPLSAVSDGKVGGINIIDLANIDSCCFIETQDLGKRINKFQFEVLGRFDNSDIRGCNLMAQ